MSRKIAGPYLAAVMLFSEIGFLSNPAYRLWALGSLALLGPACVVIRTLKGRLLLVAAAALIGLLSFLIGYYHYSDGQLSEAGRSLVYFLMPVVPVVSLQLFLIERGDGP